MVLWLRVIFHLTEKEILDLTPREAQQMFEYGYQREENNRRVLANYFTNGAHVANHGKSHDVSRFLSKIAPLTSKDDDEEKKTVDDSGVKEIFESLGMGKQNGK